MQNLKKYALFGYLLLIHIAGFTVLLEPEILNKIRAQLGLSSYAYDGYHAITHAHYQRNDANTAPGSLIFIGDSHIKGLNVASIAGNAVNFGIGGDTITGLTTRLAAYESPKQAKVIVTLAGTNDLIRGSVAEAKAEADALTAQLRKIGAPHFIISIPPIRQSIRALSNEKIDQVNSHYQETCTDLCTYVDINTALKDEAGILSRDYAETDGLHLSPHGYAIVQQKLTTALLARLSSNQL